MIEKQALIEAEATTTAGYVLHATNAPKLIINSIYKLTVHIYVDPSHALSPAYTHTYIYPKQNYIEKRTNPITGTTLF